MKNKTTSVPQEEQRAEPSSMPSGQRTTEHLTEISITEETKETSEESPPQIISTPLTELPVDEHPNEEGFAMGDHVYRLPGMFGLSQQHGVVLKATKEINSDGENKWILEVMEFYPDQKNNEKDQLLETEDADGTAETSKDEPMFISVQTMEQTDRKTVWHKVQYQAGWIRRHVGRSGSSTAAARDGRGLVRARLEFLMELNRARLQMLPLPLHEYSSKDQASTLKENDALKEEESTEIDNEELRLPPRYDWVKANSECLSVWCQTGTWATLQASSWLSVTAAGQVKSAATLATVASTSTVTVPAAGLWGFLGYTTKVSILATNPIILPAICGYGVVTVGAPLWWLRRAKQSWKQNSIDMNSAFWDWAQQKEDFAECMIEWSD